MECFIVLFISSTCKIITMHLFYFIARHSLNKNQASSFVEWVITIVNGGLVESFAGDSYNLETLKIIIEDELIYDNYHKKNDIN